jgi:glycosyltransferase involved in cell wall biosynthesis
MKIAVVAPSPIPFTVGGAENLFWGLQDYLNLETSHQCELMKLPSAEADLWGIVDSYEAFFRHDLSYFDAIITTKYPAWMVAHPNHVCYMLHTLRGLYDTYHFCGQPLEFSWGQRPLADLRRHMDRISSAPNPDTSALLDFFGMVRALRSSDLPIETFRFPGPFSREIVHFMDGYGLALSRVKRFAAISANVRGRRDYFPSGAQVSVIYPPPRLTGYHCGSDDYLFTASRLDGPKRIGLLIEAMRHVESDIPLLIAGTGPDEPRLRELAGDDHRIVFLGFVRDSQMLDYYANALAIPFVPYDEDYGLITIEAMKSGKPVLTVSDSGGPNEFVRTGTTGYSVAPEPMQLADRIDYLCNHRDEAREMGENARELVRSINWKTVADGLLPAESRPIRTVASLNTGRPARKKLVVATTFPIAPPRGGGQARIFHLYRYLARSIDIDIDIVSLCNFGEPGFEGHIAPGLREIRIPKSQAHHFEESELSRSVGWVPITDIAMTMLYKQTPEYVAALSEAARDSFAVVASHPYTLDAIQECAPNRPLWFEAHNVEYTLKRDILPDSEAGRALLHRVRDCEGRCWSTCEVAFACTQTDLDLLATLYGATTALTLEVPNGFSLDDVPKVSHADRRRLKERLGFGKSNVALFMGSWHGPNLAAVEQILGLASKLPSVKFLVVGSAGLAFRDRVFPDNVLITGPVGDEEKALLLSAADIALNPIVSGSGSNLKMLDYAAAGLPILSTPFGARGFEFSADRHYLSADLDNFLLELTAAFATVSAREAIAQSAKELVDSRYSWKLIAEQFSARLGSSVVGVRGSLS